MIAEAIEPRPRGVTFHRRINRWQAQIRYQGRSRYLGVFLTAEAAAEAYEVAVANPQTLNVRRAKRTTAIDLVNHRYGALIVLRRSGHRHGKVAWLCRCDCGNQKVTTANQLRTGKVTHCGDRSNDFHSKHHNCRDNRTYRSWCSAKQRCFNPKAVGFKNYGGRGITMCERWVGSFETFLADMGERPDGKTLDRWPNNDGNYEPGNCRWATTKEQHENRVRAKSFAEMIQKVQDLNQRKPLPQMVETMIDCPDCENGYYDYLEPCRACKGTREVPAMRCSACGMSEDDNCQCDS